MKYDMRIAEVYTANSVRIEVLASQEGRWHTIATLSFYEATEDAIRTGFENVCKEHARVQEILDKIYSE